jgi:hypothetical protein
MRLRISHPQGFAATASKGNADVGASVRSLYVRALSRVPTEAEVALARGYVERKVAAVAGTGGDAGAQASAGKAAWEDVVWSVLNTKEFLFNH